MMLEPSGGMDDELRSRTAVLRERSKLLDERIQQMSNAELCDAGAEIRREVTSLADEGDHIRAIYEGYLMGQFRLTA